MTRPPGVSVINYQYGRNINIIQSLIELDNTKTLKGTKYPLMALVLPVVERRGRPPHYYATVNIKRFVISTIAYGETKVKDRFAEGGTFKTILYPLYYEFLDRVAQSPNVIGGDPDMILHDIMPNPGDIPIAKESNDYVDSIEILNLELTLNQIKTC